MSGSDGFKVLYDVKVNNVLCRGKIWYNPKEFSSQKDAQIAFLSWLESDSLNDLVLGKSSKGAK